MLAGEKFVQWCQQLGLVAGTRKYIEQVRNSPPSRRVRSAMGNVSGRYPSRKMGVTIQLESHHNELAGILEMEYDAQVWEYDDQPPAIKLCYHSASGRKVGVLHTPDFFVLRQDSVGWEEWKTQAELVRLASKMPGRYVSSEGQWRCPPGEAVAQSMGLYYQIRSSEEIDWIWQNNVHFLKDSFRSDEKTVEEKVSGEIAVLVSQKPGMTLSELKSYGYKPDDIYLLIAQKRLDVNLRGMNIAVVGEQLQIWPAAFKETGAPRAEFKEASLGELATQSVELKVGLRVVWNVSELLEKASIQDCAEANRRYSLIAPYLSGKQATNNTVTERTIRRCLRAWREAEVKYGYGYVGLLPVVQRKGNRTPKLPATTQKLIDEVIANNYLNLKQQGKFAVYSQLVSRCEQLGMTPPSYKTFVRKINVRSRHC